MSEMYRVYSRGIAIPHDEVLNGTLDQNQLRAAGYELLNPCSGTIDFYRSVGPVKLYKPFWFLPISHTGPIPPCSKKLQEIEQEVMHCYSDVFLAHDVTERLCRVNGVCEKIQEGEI